VPTWCTSLLPHMHMHDVASSMTTYGDKRQARCAPVVCSDQNTSSVPLQLGGLFVIARRTDFHGSVTQRNGVTELQKRGTLPGDVSDRHRHVHTRRVRHPQRHRHAHLQLPYKHLLFRKDDALLRHYFFEKDIPYM
jgi:hypothetical protein